MAWQIFQHIYSSLLQRARLGLHVNRILTSLPVSIFYAPPPPFSVERDVLDAIDVAKDEEDDEEVFEMRDRLSTLQGELFSEAPTVPAATQNKGFLGLFRGSHASGTPAGNSTRDAKASNEKKRPAPKSKPPPRKKVAGSHPSAKSRAASRTSSGRTTHPPAAFVAGPASRRGNDDTIAGSRADAQLSTSLLTGGGKLPSSSSSTTATTPPNTGRDATTCVSVSCSSSVTSQNTLGYQHNCSTRRRIVKSHKLRI